MLLCAAQRSDGLLRRFVVQRSVSRLFSTDPPSRPVEDATDSEGTFRAVSSLLGSRIPDAKFASAFGDITRQNLPLSTVIKLADLLNDRGKAQQVQNMVHRATQILQAKDIAMDEETIRTHSTNLMRLSAQVANAKNTRAVLTLVKDLGVRPTEQMYTWHLRACHARAALAAEDETLDCEMRDAGVPPSSAFFALLLRVLTDLNKLEAAAACHKRVCDAHMENDAACEVPILRLLKVSKRYDEASSYFAGRLSGGSPPPSPQAYRAMMVIYNERMQSGDVARLFADMKERGLPIEAAHVTELLISYFRAHNMAAIPQALRFALDRDLLPRLPQSLFYKWTNGNRLFLVGTRNADEVRDFYELFVRRRKVRPIPYRFLRTVLLKVFGAGQSAYGLDVIQEAIHAGTKLDVNLISTLIESACHQQNTAAARKLVDFAHGLHHRLSHDMYIHLINAHARRRDAVGAEALFTLALERDQVTPSLILFNCMLKAHARSGNIAGIEAISDQMRARGIQRDLTSFKYITLAHAINEDAASAERAIDEMQEAGIDVNTICYNNLLKIYVKRRDEAALKLYWTRMRAKQVPPDAHTYSLVIAGLAYSGLPKEAAQLMDTMFQEGVQPVSATADPILRVYIEAGMMDEAVALFRKLGVYRIRPDAALCKAIVAGLLQAGDVHRATTLIKHAAEHYGVAASEFTTAEG